MPEEDLRNDDTACELNNTPKPRQLAPRRPEYANRNQGGTQYGASSTSFFDDDDDSDD